MIIQLPKIIITKKAHNFFYEVRQMTGAKKKVHIYFAVRNIRGPCSVPGPSVNWTGSWSGPLSGQSSQSYYQYTEFSREKS